MGEIIPDRAWLPSKGKPKIFLGVLRVVAVFAVRAEVAVVAVTAVVAVAAVAADVAKVALIAVLAVFAVRAVVAVLAFPVRSPTKFEEVTEAKPDKLVYVPPKAAIVDPNVT